MLAITICFSEKGESEEERLRAEIEAKKEAHKKAVGLTALRKELEDLNCATALEAKRMSTETRHLEEKVKATIKKKGLINSKRIW